ncbi:MarR family transcriptional regulator [Streptomyces tremellae]|uniref:HTH marR-type domain-containing protein n=1 Tax=Streptomyces tremellae TaxID=1124239 RepID=A0ABP7FE33_9ACTN
METPDRPDAPAAPHAPGREAGEGTEAGPDARRAGGSAAGRDASDRDGQLAEQLLRLTRRIHRIQKHRLGPVGITPAQGRLLRTVAYCVAHRDGPPRMADLAALLEVVPRAVTTLVDGLEANGWARRVPDPANRRVIRVELTDAGHGTLRALRDARRSAAEEVLAPLGDEQRETLGELLSALVDAPPDAWAAPGYGPHRGG